MLQPSCNYHHQLIYSHYMYKDKVACVMDNWQVPLCTYFLLGAAHIRVVEMIPVTQESISVDIFSKHTL